MESEDIKFFIVGVYFSDEKSASRHEELTTALKNEIPGVETQYYSDSDECVPVLDVKLRSAEDLATVMFIFDLFNKKELPCQ